MRHAFRAVVVAVLVTAATNAAGASADARFGKAGVGPRHATDPTLQLVTAGWTRGRAHTRVVRAPSPGGGKAICVGVGKGCFASIQDALDAASDGDSIRIGPGTFAGGFVVDKSVALIGASAAATRISGGGPVITVGTFFADSEPTVTISGLTVTGGITTSSPQADLFFGVPDAWAIGGGIYIPPADGFAPGATVTIANSVITGNKASPTGQIGPTPDQEESWPVCPNGFCPFAGASGGGIASDGYLTLLHTTVSNNQAIGPIASDALGGGIYVGFAGGSLTLINSTVSGNVAHVSDPNGRFAEGGGIFTAFGDTVTLTHTLVSGNTASLTSTFPFFVGQGDVLELGINSGGIHIGDGGSATISDTRVEGNTVEAIVPQGQPEVFDSGLCSCGGSVLDLRNSSVSNNRLRATMQTTANVFAMFGFSAGGALEFDGPATLSRVRVSGNSTVVHAAGDAIGSGALNNFFSDAPALVEDSVISGNSVVARSDSGAGEIFGAGVLNAGQLELRGDDVRGNTAIVAASSGLAQGAGIWNGVYPGGPPVALTISDSKVMLNALVSGPGVTLLGGGLFTTDPVTLSNTRITHNAPNDCSGTSC